MTAELLPDLLEAENLAAYCCPGSHRTVAYAADGQHRDSITCRQMASATAVCGRQANRWPGSIDPTEDIRVLIANRGRKVVWLPRRRYGR